jgi:Zn-dependent membrane protease YugP
MHPAIVVAPALALIFGPRLWVGHVLKTHNRRDEAFALTAGELARELLDRHGLQAVRVESTDIGDHYDPQARAVRLTRDKLDRKTLTAVTTAAHEVAHALQDASGYGPFAWRSRLVQVARVTGQVGTVLFLSVPVVGALAPQRLPPTLVGVAALAMLGTGVAAQLAALPSELDASFRRALPLLRDGYLDQAQARDASKILTACSLTYVASSLVAVLHIWPWLGGAGPVYVRPPVPAAGMAAGGTGGPRTSGPGSRVRLPASKIEPFVRAVAKPLIRGWFRLSGSL